ncbi:hypothetical protein VTO42DRAFT_3258 [Malbranchea cinnamomea]
MADLAREFKVDYQRLRRRILDTPSRFTPRPQTQKLDSAQEKAAIAWIKHLDEAGRSPTQEMLTNCANSVLCRSHIDPETAPPTVSEMWANRFVKRLSKYKRIKQQLMETKRIQAKDIGIVQSCMQKAKAALENIGMVIDQASPTLNSRLQKIFRGSLLQAELNAQREEHLNRYLQASQRRKRKITRGHVQAGGPLYVKDANRKIEERKVEETKRAWERRRRQQIRDGKKKAGSTTGNGEGSEIIEEIARKEPGELGSLLFFIDTQGAWPN